MGRPTLGRSQDSQHRDAETQMGLSELKTSLVQGQLELCGRKHRQTQFLSISSPTPCHTGLEGKGEDQATVLLNRVEATLKQFPEEAGNQPQLSPMYFPSTPTLLEGSFSLCSVSWNLSRTGIS